MNGFVFFECFGARTQRSVIRETGKGFRSLTIFFPGSVEIAGLFEGTGPLRSFRGSRGDQRIIPAFRTVLHCLQPKPQGGFFHHAGRGPLMWSVEATQEMVSTEFFQTVVHSNHFTVVEIVSPDAGENCEGRVVNGRGFRLESRSIEENSGRALAKLGEARCHSRTARKPSEIKTVTIYREAILRIFEHCLRRFGLDFPGTVPR